MFQMILSNETAKEINYFRIMVRSSLRYIFRSKITSQSIRKEIHEKICYFKGKNLGFLIKKGKYMLKNQTKSYWGCGLIGIKVINLHCRQRALFVVKLHCWIFQVK